MFSGELLKQTPFSVALPNSSRKHKTSRKLFFFVFVFQLFSGGLFSVTLGSGLRPKQLGRKKQNYKTALKVIFFVLFLVAYWQLAPKNQTTTKLLNSK